MHRLTRSLITILVALSIAGIFAIPVSAISAITNKMSISSTSFTCNKSITVKTDTDFSWFPPPNPYSSDYAIAINAYHLRAPSIYYRVGETASFAYKSSEGSINNNPAYWYASGLQWFLGIQSYHHYLYATFTSAKKSSSPAAKFDQRKNWHGQADIFSSYADPAIYYTTLTNSSSC
jgi:hypothetical protein